MGGRHIAGVGVVAGVVVAVSDAAGSYKENHMWEYCRGTADADTQVHLRMARALAVGSGTVRVEYTDWCWCC